jgi:hypothetical protein
MIRPSRLLSRILSSARPAWKTPVTAKRFFELTDRQLHRIICYCQFGATVSAATAAHHLRKLIARQRMFTRLRGMLVR